MDNIEIEKSKAYNTAEIIEYDSDAVATKTIIKRPTGDISMMAFNPGQEMAEQTTPFDTFAQIIDGKAEIVINGVSTILSAGQSILLPGHKPNFIKPNGPLKIIFTVIKSGYE